MENKETQKVEVKANWVKPEVKELDINKTANNSTSFNLDADFFS